jgi:hypothetical protein
MKKKLAVTVFSLLAVITAGTGSASALQVGDPVPGDGGGGSGGATPVPTFDAGAYVRAALDDFEASFSPPPQARAFVQSLLDQIRAAWS